MTFSSLFVSFFIRIVTFIYYSFVCLFLYFLFHVPRCIDCRFAGISHSFTAGVCRGSRRYRPPTAQTRGRRQPSRLGGKCIFLHLLASPLFCYVLFLSSSVIFHSDYNDVRRSIFTSRVDCVVSRQQQQKRATRDTHNIPHCLSFSLSPIFPIPFAS